MRVKLFVTCLVDQFFPNVGESTVRLLRRAGVDVDFPKDQTCCGQLGFNGGYQNEARTLCKRFLDIFEGDDPIIAPSGSCATMVRNFYPELVQHESPELQQRVQQTARRTYELSEFLVNVLGKTDLGLRLPAPVTATYHDCCHALRELGIGDAPRALLKHVQNLELIEMADSRACCGFGGTFSIKFPEISTAMMRDKMAAIDNSGAQVVTALDISCLMQIGGGLSRQQSSVKPIHLADVLSAGL
ncbi:MAG: (Fe-S)-binding protein [Dehalococcoidia bacterium]|nr:(Fe-S)-binding protein [Dehalococcoidia bacterium]